MFDDVPGGKDRGAHAYKENEEFIVALSGSFDVELDDGQVTSWIFNLWKPQELCIVYSIHNKLHYKQ